MVLKFTDSQLERDYAVHHASLSFQTDFLFSALNGLVRAPCWSCNTCRRLLNAPDVDACHLQVWLLACGKNHNLIEGEVWAILMLKVVAGFVPPVLIWQVPTFYKRVREPLVLCLRVLTMVGTALAASCSPAALGPIVQAPCSFLKQRLAFQLPSACPHTCLAGSQCAATVHLQVFEVLTWDKIFLNKVSLLAVPVSNCMPGLPVAGAHL